MINFINTAGSGEAEFEFDQGLNEDWQEQVFLGSQMQSVIELLAQDERKRKLA